MSKTDINTFENKFPSIEKAKSFIKELRNIDLANTSLEEIDNLINRVFKYIPFQTGTINKGEILFRVRVNKNQSGFENISQLGLNRRDKYLDSDYGRANRPNESIFYCSDNFGLACAEVLHNLKDSFNRKTKIAVATVSEWETLRTINISPVFYSEAVLKVRKDVANIKDSISKFYRSKELFKTETLDVSDLILEFFCDEFSKDEISVLSDYKFSVWYMWKLKRMNDLIHPQFIENKFDGIVYPGVAMRYKGDNIALIADDLDKKIKFKTAYELLCTEFDFENAIFKYAKIGELESFDTNGNLKWRII
ncbi:MAG: hypothetical protein WCS69_09470 [Ignavibacteriaceae bacterium]|jgi:hypothetical protein